MRKTTAPPTPPEPPVSAPKKVGLSAKAKQPRKSAETTRALDTRSHRTMVAVDSRVREAVAGHRFVGAEGARWPATASYLIGCNRTKR